MVDGIRENRIEMKGSLIASKGHGQITSVEFIDIWSPIKAWNRSQQWDQAGHFPCTNITQFQKTKVKKPVSLKIMP